MLKDEENGRALFSIKFDWDKEKEEMRREERKFCSFLNTSPKVIYSCAQLDQVKFKIKKKREREERERDREQ